MADMQEEARATRDDAQQERIAGGIEDGARKRPGKRPLVVLAIAVLATILVAGISWFGSRNEETTDDAFTDGNVVTITPAVAGYVVQLLVNDNQRVRTGDVLFRIDPRDYENTRNQLAAELGVAQAQLRTAQVQLVLAQVQYPAQLAQAKARQESAAASLTNARAVYERQRSVDERATTQQSIDAAAAQQRAGTAILTASCLLKAAAREAETAESASERPVSEQ